MSQSTPHCLRNIDQEGTPINMSKNETLARALQLLLLYNDEPEFGIREMSRRLTLSGSVVYRLADTLCDYRFLYQDPGSKRYTLGPSCLQLAERFRSDNNFARICLSQMDRLRDRTDETIAFHLYRDGLRTCILESQSPQSIRHVMRLGASFPIANGASDIIIRASVSDLELQRIEERFLESDLPLQRPTTDDFAQFEARGWTTSDGARTPGGMAVAAPVPHRDAIYVLSILGPRERIIATGIEYLGELVVATAAEMRVALGPLHATL